MVDPTREIGTIRLVVLALLFVGHLLFSTFAVAPGHFVSDEGIYHQMAKAFADNGSLTLWADYGKLPSPELRTWNHVIGKDGSLQSQYPYLHPVLAWPFYKLAGFRGLFALNAVAYLVFAGMAFLLANRLWRDRRIAADSVILLTLATYAWQYSQAAWSQLLSSAFLVTALYFGVRATQAESDRDALRHALAAGLITGLGAGVRLDVIFLAPALLFPFLYDGVPRLRVAAAIVVGVLPGLVLLSLTNYAKFGIFQPLTYGRSAGAVSFGTYIPLIALGFSGLAAAWIATRNSIWPLIVRHRFGLSAAAVALAGIVMLLAPTVASMAVRLLRGTWILIADLSLLDPSIMPLGVTRGPAGAIMYADTVKKALLQSLPWLPIVAVAISSIPRNRASVLPQAAPILTVLAFLTVYGWSTWHGGYAFNLRYFVPLLPIFAIYAAKGTHALLEKDASPTVRRLAVATAVAAGAVWLFMLFRDTEIAAIEAVTLNLPLRLATILTALLLPLIFWRPYAPLRRLAVLAVFACLAWSFVISLLMDFPRSWFLRQARYETGIFLASHVPQNALLFSNYDPASFSLTEVQGARNVWVSMDDYGDAREILQAGIDEQRPLLAFFSDEDWVEFEARGMLDGMRTTEIADGTYATLYRLEPVQVLTNGTPK